MKTTVTKAIINTATLSTMALLASCAATTTALEHRNLEVSTKLSQTVFLDPVASAQKTVFIAIKNTSQESINIDAPLARAIKDKGYKVVNNPSQAHYLLQANVLSVGKMSQAASKAALGGGYGSALAGAGAGVALGALSNNSNAMLAGGIAGGLVGMAADSLVKDINYVMITDVQISERVGRGVVKEQFSAALKNGTASGTTQTLSKSSDYQRYRIRIASNANQVNLSFAKARPALEEGLITTLSGIF